MYVIRGREGAKKSEICAHFIYGSPFLCPLLAESYYRSPRLIWHPWGLAKVSY